MRNCIIAILVSLVVGIGFGRYLIPTNTKEEKKTEQSTETQKEVIDKEITRPDGTKEKERIVRDVKKDTTKKETSKEILFIKPEWRVSAQAGYSFDNTKPVYGAIIEKRILGSVFVGVWANTEKTLGVSVGTEL